MLCIFQVLAEEPYVLPTDDGDRSKGRLGSAAAAQRHQAAARENRAAAATTKGAMWAKENTGWMGKFWELPISRTFVKHALD